METHVFLNHGRWVARCPLLDLKSGSQCGGAQLAERIGTHFTCVACGNRQVHGQPIPVVWPPGELREAVERITSLRPLEENRNWIPGESIDDLRLENQQHGVK